MTDDPQTLHTALTPAFVTEVLQATGFRVVEGRTQSGEPVLSSATGGLAFEVRFFNPLATRPSQGQALGEASRQDQDAATAEIVYADAGLRAAFHVQGELPLSLVNTWNAAHRFARLSLVPEWLLLDMDVIVLGGVRADNLRAQIEIWDRLVHELIAYLRAELPKLAKAALTVEAESVPSAVPEAVLPEAVSPAAA